MSEDKPPRVLMVMEATIGGTKRHLCELSVGLHSRGWPIEVACPRVRAEAHGDTSFWADLDAAGVSLRTLPMERKIASRVNLKAIGTLAHLIRNASPPVDVVHAHSAIGGVVARLAVIAAASLGNRPWVVYTPHGFAFLDGSPIRRRAFLAVEQLLGRATDRLIGVSPTEAEVAWRRRVVPIERVVAIPNGIDPAAMPTPEDGVRARAEEKWGHGPVVITVARMTPQKDPSTWLRVAARVAATRPDVRFVWVWGGETAMDVRAETSRLGIADRVDFVGYRADARRLIAGASVFLLASRFEGLPYSLIEALAVGVPVVATDVTGTRDVVRHGETGLLAPAGDVEGLAEHVLSLLAEPTRGAAMASAGRKDVAQRFSIDAMINATATVYRSVARSWE
jgi:glycosyltransferase involved in cell wall biosynthesis